MRKEKPLILRWCTNFQSITGEGIKGNINGKTVLVGKQKFIEDSRINIPDDLKKQAMQLQGNAQTVIWVAVEGKVMGILGISDPIKETTKNAIDELHKLGLKIVMLTGIIEKRLKSLPNNLELIRWKQN